MSNFIPCIIKGEIHDIPSWLVAKNPSHFKRADPPSDDARTSPQFPVFSLLSSSSRAERGRI